ncbi:MAG: hypothetical protein HWN66_16230 [Candidatus Helarchaeota archaeon]|nr:hypothetical protein [Candidatus Helarchaeota archaeon]
MRTDFNRTFNLFELFNATVGFKQRQDIYRNGCKFSNNLNAQPARVYLGENVSESSISNSLDKIYNYEDCMDFRMNSLIRLLYIDVNRSILGSSIKDQVCDAFGKGKYWYTEPSEDSAIFFTENHQILYHTAEYLVGQLFPNDTFTNSGMNGTEHVLHARPLIIRWLDWRAQFGFAEWHSNVYIEEDIAALVNLVDFAEDQEIVFKAAMVLDIIAFGFAMNYYGGRYATTAGRTYDNKKVGTSESSPASRDSTAEPAWIMLGIGNHSSGDSGNLGAVALATSDHYAPPPILEAIAANASLYNEHKERNSIDVSEGPSYNLSYNESDMMFWWGMQAYYMPQTIDETLNILDKYDIDPMTACGPQILIDFFKISATLHGLSLSDYIETLKLFTQGVCLESANIYTYRTPHYQLSGAQDQQKGLNSFQEHIWQATLDDNAFVYTNSPGGITKDFEQLYVGGWKPRATLYKNVGIIQYDREMMPLEGELLVFFLNLFMGFKFYQHAYFPRWAFDEVRYHDKWIFGAKGDGYIALYSHEPTWWESNYELRVWGYKNLWIVELGSVDEHGSFDQFVSAIRQAQVDVNSEAIGYEVSYESPSQGVVSVAWDGPMNVNGTNIDLGPYPRFDTDFCQQEFGTKKTIIQHGNQSLELDFYNITRIFQQV